MDAWGQGVAGAASVFGGASRSVLDRNVFGPTLGDAMMGTTTQWTSNAFQDTVYDDQFGTSTRQAFADQSALALNENYNGIGSKLGAWYNPQMLTGGSGLAPSWTQGLPKLRRWDSEESDAGGSGEIYGNNDEWLRKTMPWLYDTTVPVGSVGGGGKLGETDTGYEILDTFNDEIAAAVQRVYAETGVLIPANLFKAMFFREGGGKGLSRGPSGQWFGRGANNPIYGFNGVSKEAADSYGIDYNRMLTDDTYALYAMGLTIQRIASGDSSQWGKPGTVVQNFGWEGVAARYFSGNPDPTGNWGDENGDTVQSYLYHPQGGVVTNAQKWDLLGGGTGNLGTVGSGGAGSIGSIWGNIPGIEEGQGFGQTEFSRSALGQMYYRNFSPEVWGFEGGHPGRDYSTPYGTQLYSPVTGTVITAGGTPYYYNNGRPSVAGEGELAIKLDNGDVVVMGHMSRINVQIGQRITANTLVGLSGTENGDHLHLEYRLYDPNWTGNAQNHRIVDPATALQGGFTEGGAVTAAQQQARGFNDVLQMAMRGDLRAGMPIPYAGASGLRGTEFNQLLHGSIMGALGATNGFTLTPGEMITRSGAMPTTPGATPGQPGSNLPASGTALTQLAQQYVGTPYSLGGQSPTDRGLDGTTGWDCSGFTRWVYGQQGIQIPAGSHAQLNGGTSVTWAQLQPGDLMFFDLQNGQEYREGNYASHVAMYLGNGMIVHAANPGDGTVIAPVTTSYYTDNFLGARRYT